MAKKKTRTKVISKKVETLSTIFDCPFCDNKKTVEVKITKKEMKGVAKCRICKKDYATKATNLTDPIDIYSEWIDECEKLNKKYQ